DPDREHAPLAADFEKCRLILIGGSWLNFVVGANRNVERLLGIAVVVANQQCEAAIRVRVPPLKRRRNAGAALTRRIQRQRALWSLGRRDNEGPQDQDSRQKRLQQLLLLWDVRGTKNYQFQGTLMIPPGNRGCRHQYSAAAVSDDVRVMS